MFRTASLASTLLLAVAVPTFVQAEDGALRIVPQILVGTSGFEPGVAVEFGIGSASRLILRPEVFVSDDGIGGGAAVLWSLAKPFQLGDRNDFAVGPRLVHHNADEHGLEFSAMGIWSIGIGSNLNRRHAIEIIGALGAVDEIDDDDDDDNDDEGIGFAASVGVGYAYRF